MISTRKPLLSVLDPDEKDGEIAILRKEFTESIPIPHKKLKIAEIISKKNNVIGHMNPNQRRINVKRTMNHQNPKSIPNNKHAPIMQIEIHTIRFKGIKPVIWATLTLMSHQRTVMDIMTDEFNIESVKKHFPHQLAQHVMEQFKKETQNEIKFDYNKINNQKDKERFKGQIEFMHQQKVKEVMLQEAQFHIIKRNETSIFTVHKEANAQMRNKPTFHTRKKPKRDCRRFNMMRRNIEPHSLDDQKQTKECVIDVHMVKEDLIFKVVIHFKVNNKIFSSHKKLMTVDHLQSTSPTTVLGHMMNQKAYEAPISKAELKFNETIKWAQREWANLPIDRRASKSETRRFNMKRNDPWFQDPATVNLYKETLHCSIDDHEVQPRLRYNIIIILKWNNVRMGVDKRPVTAHYLQTKSPMTLIRYMKQKPKFKEPKTIGEMNSMKSLNGHKMNGLKFLLTKEQPT